MADCFLILLRSYVRVDGLLLRSLETRYMGWLSMAGHHAGACPCDRLRNLASRPLLMHAFSSRNRQGDPGQGIPMAD